MTPSIDQLAAALGWFGKLPAAGDFVQRRLPSELVSWWRRWLEPGLLGLKADPTYHYAYAHAPIWNYALPAAHGAEYVQLGCIAPSRDRVGRSYPLLTSLFVPPEYYEAQFLEGANRFLRTEAQALQQAVSLGCTVAQFDQAVQSARLNLTEMLKRESSEVARTEVSDGMSDIMSILNEGHGDAPTEQLDKSQLLWTDLAMYFEPQGTNSFWWTSQVTGAPLNTKIHGGAPNTTLFKNLFVQY